MSAGGLSYHGVIGHTAKATLPSVDSYYTDMNILRDPPKMVMTRKIDKVGETSSITQMVEDSSDRACEAILTYARGVNPFASVSYQNYGNNGGQRVNGFSSSRRGGNLAGRQARLPYSLGPQGSFRPPAVPQQNLYPLSRLPRIWTSAFTKPGFADFSKKMICPTKGDSMRQIKSDDMTLRTCVRPTATYQIQAPITENFEVKYVIKNPTHISAQSGRRTADITEQYVGMPTKEVNTNPLHADAQSNLKSVKHIDNNHMNTDKYIQNPLHTNVQSNVSQNIQLIPIEDIVNVDVRVKNQFNIPYAAPVKGHEKTDKMHDDPHLQRVTPLHNATTNISRQDRYVNPIQGQIRQLQANRPHAIGITNQSGGRQHGGDNMSSRNYNLKPTINPGSFQGKATIPVLHQENNIPQLESLRQRTNRRVMDMQQGRHS